MRFYFVFENRFRCFGISVMPAFILYSTCDFPSLSSALSAVMLPASSECLESIIGILRYLQVEGYKVIAMDLQFILSLAALYERVLYHSCCWW